MNIPKRILPVIVIAQFCCTSLWFAGNAVMQDMAQSFLLPESALGHLTSMVQFGFITGTLIFAFLTIADRFSPSKVFLINAVFGAFFNLGVIWEGNTLTTLLVLRFLTGFSLAGIYPIGMKIAADYYVKGLGKSLGFLVGALVLGTAFPHLLKSVIGSLPWVYVLISTSGVALLGGMMMLILVPNGPFRKPSQKLELMALFRVFQHKSFRAAAFGYFGHMWELYAFWAFVPVILRSYAKLYVFEIDISIWSFIIIGIGGFSCVIGGYLSERYGAKKIAYYALFLSGLCSLVAPLFFLISSKVIFFLFLLFWGMVVIADSPLFSTLVAYNSSPEIKGTALTIVNSIGFAITIVSIQLLAWLVDVFSTYWVYSILAIGPIWGLINLGSPGQD